MRRAKIVATFGPALAEYEKTKAVIEAGVDVARLNLSHGSHEVHEGVYATIRRASEETGKAVGILVDLQGPKIRLGKFKEDKLRSDKYFQEHLGLILNTLILDTLEIENANGESNSEIVDEEGGLQP